MATYLNFGAARLFLWIRISISEPGDFSYGYVSQFRSREIIPMATYLNLGARRLLVHYYIEEDVEILQKNSSTQVLSSISPLRNGHY